MFVRGLLESLPPENDWAPDQDGPAKCSTLYATPVRYPTQRDALCFGLAVSWPF